MGAKDWMVIYADGDVGAVLRSRPKLDRDATRALVGRLYSAPAYQVTEVEDGSLDQANPPDGLVYAGCFPGLAIVCTGDVALDHPSQLDDGFREVAAGRTVYLHAMHSVVDWFAYAIWGTDGTLRRALSLSPDSGILENIGEPLAFEASYWAGEQALDDGVGKDAYPLPFHPLELAEDALRHLFGFNYEGAYRPDDPDLEDIVLAGFAVD